jgi:hypothetical protein
MAIIKYLNQTVIKPIIYISQVKLVYAEITNSPHVLTKGLFLPSF